MNMNHIGRSRTLAGFLLAVALTGFLAAADSLEMQPAAAVDMSGYWQVELRGIQSDSNAERPTPFSEIAYMWLYQESDGYMYGSLILGDGGIVTAMQDGGEDLQNPMGTPGIRVSGLVTASRVWLHGQGSFYPGPDPVPNITVIINYYHHAIMAWGVTGFNDMVVGKFHYMIFEGVPSKNSIGTEDYTGIMGTFRAYKIAEMEDEL